jgi:uncharacterized protein
MRKLLLLLVLLVLVIPAYAQISVFVDDKANVILPQDKIKIEGVLKNIYDSKKAQYAVVVVRSLDGKDIESYALNLAQGNIGGTDENNGLLLLVAVEDRKYRFEVGRGIEPILNDAKVGRIGRDYLVENFKNGNYGQGILEASVAIATEFDVELTAAVPNVSRGRRGSSVYSFLFFFLFVLSAFGGGMGRRHSRRNRFFNAALMAGLMFGGRGRGGMGGMGGGSFGGGSFGGGGSSGGW